MVPTPVETVFGATKSGLSPTHLFRHFYRYDHGCFTESSRLFAKRRNKTKEQTRLLFQDTPILKGIQSIFCENRIFWRIWRKLQNRCPRP